MGERGLSTKHIVVDANICIFEGVHKRPQDCLNNPLKYPKNLEIYRISRRQLPSCHIRYKQELFASNPSNALDAP